MASYRYWRLKVTAAPGAFIACNELHLRTSYGGEQAAVGGTPLADSFFSGLPPSLAFDNQQHHWACNGSGTNAWIGYDFGTPKEVVEITYTLRNDVGYMQNWTTGTVDGSNDGVAWTPVQTVNAAAWTHAGQTQTFTVQGAGPSGGFPGLGSHRYWRIRPTALHANASGYLACVQLVWRITPGGAQQASGGTALASGTIVPRFPSEAYDGDPGTMWVAGTGANAWLGYDFGAPKQIAEIAYTCRNDSGYEQIFTGAEIHSSDDGVNWARAVLITAAAWSTGSTQTFTVQAAAAAAARPVVFVCT